MTDNPIAAIRTAIEEELIRAKAEGVGDLSMVYLTIDDANAVLRLLGTAQCDEGLDQWIERNFAYKSIAHRREEEEPWPGEPFISLETAKDLTRQAVKDFAAALTAAGEMAGERPGWKLVPVEPTNDMVDAGLEEDNWVSIEIYRAMIAAAPASPVVEDVVEKVARAIYESQCIDSPPAYSFESLSNDQESYYKSARAVLAAIGER